MVDYSIRAFLDLGGKRTIFISGKLYILPPTFHTNLISQMYYNLTYY